MRWSRSPTTHGRADLALLQRGLRVLALAQRGKHDLRAGCRRCEDRVESGVASGTGNRLLPGVARRKNSGHRSIWILWSGHCGRVLPNGWTELVALLAAFLISVLTTPAGISGAVLLLPFQVSVLGTPGPSVTPTNLLYNVVSTPGALYRTGGRDRPAAADLPARHPRARPGHCCRHGQAAQGRQDGHASHPIGHATGTRPEARILKIAS
jgi:hypothetical protein